MRELSDDSIQYQAEQLAAYVRRGGEAIRRDGSSPKTSGARTRRASWPRSRNSQGNAHECGSDQ